MSLLELLQAAAFRVMNRVTFGGQSTPFAFPRPPSPPDPQKFRVLSAVLVVVTVLGLGGLPVLLVLLWLLLAGRDDGKNAVIRPPGRCPPAGGRAGRGRTAG